MTKPIVLLGGTAPLAAGLRAWASGSGVPCVVVSRRSTPTLRWDPLILRHLPADLTVGPAQDAVMRECEAAGLVVYMVGTSLRTQSSHSVGSWKPPFAIFIEELVKRLSQCRVPLLACSTNLLYRPVERAQNGHCEDNEDVNTFFENDFYTRTHRLLREQMSLHGEMYWIDLPRIDRSATEFLEADISGWFAGVSKTLEVREPCAFRRSITLEKTSHFVAESARRIYEKHDLRVEPVPTQRERNLAYFTRQVERWNSRGASGYRVVPQHAVSDNCDRCPGEFEPPVLRLAGGML